MLGKILYYQSCIQHSSLQPCLQTIASGATLWRVQVRRPPC
ncbi:hypothetical protein PSPO01_14797 [Paraphaeosphaeria sporulosa]